MLRFLLLPFGAHIMKVLAFMILALLIPNTVFAQERTIETITIPFTSANAEISTPDHYFFTMPHRNNWILTINNNLQYNEENPEAKVVLRLKTNPEDKEFLEIGMFSPPTYRFWVAVSMEEVGYMRMFQGENSWFPDRGATVAYAQGERVTVNNGQRTVVDRLQVPGLDLHTIEVYGRDGAGADASAFSGEIRLEAMSGNPLDNPVMMVPFIVAGITAGAVATLLIIKKR